MRTLRRISCSLLLSTGIERFLKRCKKTNLSLCLSFSLVLLNLGTKRRLLSLHAAFSSIQTDREAWKLSTLFKYSTLRSLRLVIFEKPAPFLPFEKLGRAGSCFSRSSNCFEAEKIHRCARFKKRGNREGEKREKCCTRRRTVSLIYDRLPDGMKMCRNDGWPNPLERVASPSRPEILDCLHCFP